MFHVYLRWICIFYFFGVECCSIDVHYVWFLYSVDKAFHFLLNLLFCCSIHSWKWSIKVFNNYCRILINCLQLCDFLFLSLWVLFLGAYIFTIFNFNILWINIPFYHYKMFFFICNMLFCYNVYFSNIIIAIPAFILHGEKLNAFQVISGKIQRGCSNHFYLALQWKH